MPYLKFGGTLHIVGLITIPKKRVIWLLCISLNLDDTVSILLQAYTQKDVKAYPSNIITDFVSLKLN